MPSRWQDNEASPNPEINAPIAVRTDRLYPSNEGMRFLFIISHDDEFAPTPQIVTDIGTWTKKRRSEGVLIDSNPLKPASEAITVRVRAKRIQQKTGPFSRSREQMCAYVLIEAKNSEEAVSIAASHPMASAATIEVRSVWQNLR